MASDERTPRKPQGSGAPRHSSNPGKSSAPRAGSSAGGSGSGYKGGAPRKDGASGTGAPRSGAPRTGASGSGAPRTGAPYKGTSNSASAPRSGAPRSGAPRTDGSGAPRTGAPYRGTSSSAGAPRSGAPRSGGPRGDRPQRSDRSGRDERGPRDNAPVRKGPPAPEIPEEIEYGQLDKTVRARLRTLSKENAEDVGRHLIMAGNLIDTDPELAYQHALVAAARGGRVDVVREAAAVTAYATGRYSEALREFRTVRRLSGSSEHLPLMADCERGLGRPERAIALSHEPEASTLDPTGRIELAIVIAGARSDMGDNDAALVSLKRLDTSDPELQARIDEATAGILRALGRDAEAEAIAPVESQTTDFDDEDVVVYDTAEIETEESDSAEDGVADSGTEQEAKE